MESRCQIARWTRRGALIGVLTASAACSDQPETTVSSSPVTATTEAEPRTVPATFAEYEEEVRVRLVAYGDVDPGDEIPSGMMPDVRIAVIPRRESAKWWNAVGSDDWDDIPHGAQLDIPPGAQIHSTAEKIAASPIDFIATGADGTVEIYLDPSESLYHSVCVISPVGELIAGCSRMGQISKKRNLTVYIYFSHGRAYIENEQHGSERYHRFPHKDQNSSSTSSEPATVTFVSTAHTGTDVPPFIDFLAPGASLAVIDDSEIGAWWTAVSDSVTAVGDAPDPLGGYPLAVSSGWEYGWGIPYGMEVRERVLQSVPVRIIDIGWPGIIEMDMAPGDYLLCHVTYEFISDCNYDNLAAVKDYIYRVTDADIQRLSDVEGRQLLEEVKDWRIRAKRAN